MAWKLHKTNHTPTSSGKGTLSARFSKNVCVKSVKSLSDCIKTSPLLWSSLKFVHSQLKNNNKIAQRARKSYEAVCLSLANRDNNWSGFCLFSMGFIEWGTDLKVIQTGRTLLSKSSTLHDKKVNLWKRDLLHRESEFHLDLHQKSEGKKPQTTAAIETGILLLQVDDGYISWFGKSIFALLNSNCMLIKADRPQIAF